MAQANDQISLYYSSFPALNILSKFANIRYRLNYMISTSLRRILTSKLSLSYLALKNANRTYFSSNKEKESITYDDEELERIRNMFANKKLEDIEKEGENFFQGEETQLSLKVIQIDSVELLRPVIAQYANRKIVEEG